MRIVWSTCTLNGQCFFGKTKQWRALSYAGVRQQKTNLRCGRSLERLYPSFLCGS